MDLNIVSLPITYRIVIYIQMISKFDITSGYSAAQAAELLGVQSHEVTRFFRSGVLKGRKIAGDALIVDAACVQSYKSNSRGKGRPWDAQTAWAALLLLDGKDVSWLPCHRKRRLLQKLKLISAEDLVWVARRRSSAQVYSVSQLFDDGIRASLALSGISASSSAGMGLVSSVRTVDGCVREASICIPKLLGALVLKSAAYCADRRDGHRHLDDIALLSSLITNHKAVLDELHGSDRKACALRPKRFHTQTIVRG